MCPLKILREIVALFSTAENFQTTEAAITTLTDWLTANPAKLLELVRPENIEGLFTGDYNKLVSDQERGAFALPVIIEMLRKWLARLPLNVLSRHHIERRCCEVRVFEDFVLRIVPDFAFVAGLPARLLAAQNGEDIPIPITLAQSGAARRRAPPTSRCLYIKQAGFVFALLHRHYVELLPYFKAGQIDETFEQTMDRYRAASTVTLFSKL